MRPHILHISGAQEAGCIKLHDKKKNLSPFDAEKLADMIAQSSDGTLRLVILDTCYSMHQAKRLTARGVPYAMGIYDAISDDVATEFYTCFYSNLATGKSLKNSVALASNLTMGYASGNERWRKNLEDVLQMDFEPKLHIPTLSVAAGLNAETEQLW